MKKQYELIEFQKLGDEFGELVVAECGKHIPFDVKRIFYIYGTKPGVVRGRHANRKSSFLLINMFGSVKIKVDTGKKKEIIDLNRPNVGVYLDKMVWKDMYDFSEGSCLLVLSDELYDSKEYVRDYQEFLKEVGSAKT